MPRNRGKAVNCGAKRGFPTHAAATWHLARICETSGASMDGMTVYRCRHCAKFHWGHRGFHGSRTR